MDLRQQKLTSEEWDALERPVNKEEHRILQMINQGYLNVDILFNDTQSLINFIKVSENLDMHHCYFYDKYFKKIVDAIQSKYLSEILPKVSVSTKKKKPLKKKELIRIANVDKKIDSINDQIIEFVLLEQVKRFLKYHKKRKKSDDNMMIAYYTFYTLSQILRYEIRNVNPTIATFVKSVLTHFTPKMKKSHIIKYAFDLIEQNKDLHKYRDIKLYEHQKKILTLCKTPGAKLYLYQAPTGTGKTLTPIGLVSPHNPELARKKKTFKDLIMEYEINMGTPEFANSKHGKFEIEKIRKQLENLPKQRRIIFTCAAKHVGLQLAKSCISLNIKIAVAFGCKDVDGIRLHYFAAKDYIKNRRTGGIFRVDNSVGDNVQIIITDIQSYLPAMRYMMAFNKPEEITWYWDEPTITLDYSDHEYHTILQKNWKENLIPNIILSSATLPKQEDIAPCLQSFVSKFNSTNIDSVVSHDCTKTIPILDSKGFVVLPHLVYSDFATLKKSLKHIKNYQTLLRHFDLKEITYFISYVNKHVELKDRYKIETYFESIADIDVISIKQYYLKILGSLKTDYDKVFKHFQDRKKAMFESNIKLTTSDAYTLTDGPTIYMAEDIDKIGKFCLHIAKIPMEILQVLTEAINTNDYIRQEVEEVERELMILDGSVQESTSKKRGTSNDKKSKDSKKASRSGRPEADTAKKQLQRKLEELRAKMTKVELDKQFVPNTLDHLTRYDKADWLGKSFASDIPETVVEKIMLLDVDAMWKILLLMGIGVFTNNASRDYVAIMKELAQNQQLYLIIASTDYIYGTNYQFCHGYVGKDLNNLTQEKLIQAFGRVGRKNTKNDYSIRLRDERFINTLLLKSENMIEVNNMNRLFA